MKQQITEQNGIKLLNKEKKYNTSTPERVQREADYK